MANFVASVSPSAPIMAIYIHEIGRMLALPHGAALTGADLRIADLRIARLG